jgi:replicative DNA helicase
MYVSKLASAMSGVSHVKLDDEWAANGAYLKSLRADYMHLTKKFSLTTPVRPSLDDLADWLEMEALTSERKRVIFIDYLSLLVRGQYDGKDTTRIPRLCEDLKMFANKHQLVVIALHQVGRTDDSAVRRYHGSTPITPEQLMYGGEQAADIILGTYRPALDPDGNLSMEEALSQGIDQQEWQAKVDRVLAYQNDTRLQLIKNRPGVALDTVGIRLRSVGDSQLMEVVV